ncbi:MAG: lipoyl synthase [Peptococcaceae bacterium]|jgi:lipoic acid synthetase|nr:lipoyl synthase [Peptococcaceae bacterium]
MPGRRLPDWMRRPIESSAALRRTRELLGSVHTVCREARCPNLAECYGRHTATFLILGPVCTRSCAFCAVGKGRPHPVDPEEPDNVALAASRLALSHVVITSVTRDDLPDGGAAHFAAVVGAVKKECPGSVVELLVPDFQGQAAALETVLAAGPDILNHNLETVPRLYPVVRPGAGYARSLELLARAGRTGVRTKSGIMLGLGEEREEVLAVLADLRQAGVDFLTLGQYLAPSEFHYQVRAYVTPQEFEFYRNRADQAGFTGVAAGPYVRSSYRAGELAGPKILDRNNPKPPLQDDGGTEERKPPEDRTVPEHF